MSENRKLLEMNVPMWFDGKSINEALFCEDFLRTRQIIFANGAFFTPDGRVTDDLPLRGEIFEELKYCAVNNIPRKISNIIEIMKLAAHVEDFPPEQDRIHLANGTLMLDGTFTEGKPDIVRNRLPVFYRPDTPKPVLWLSFLNGLLYPEDIPTLQEFIGYCLIPSNKGQRMMVIKGNGGEGKSQIGAVLGQMLGSSMKDGSIGKISENRFARADLEHFFYYGCKHRTMTRGHKCEYKKQINEELLDGAVAEVIIKLVSNPKFAAMMQQKINMKIDTSAIEQEIANYEKQLRQSYATKSRLIDEIDTLDPDDKHYIKRKADLDDRLYKMYDKIEDTENLLIEARAKKMAIEAEKLTADNIYKVLIYFEKLYAVMDEQEKRQIMESLISEIHIYEERQPNGQWLKSIKFKLPIIEEDMEMSLDSDTHVEVVGALTRSQKSKG